jgi:hypothetical protein
VIGTVRRNVTARAWFVAAIVGSLALWQTTAYIRYWMPAFWLLVPAAVAGAAWLAGNSVRRTALAVVAGVIVAFQIPIAMANSWPDPQGLSWDYYSGKTTYREYLERRGGFEALHELAQMAPDWPRVLFTGSEAVGYWPFVPLEANVWEFLLHDRSDGPGMSDWILGMEAEYWIVNPDSSNAKAFGGLGISDVFWTPELLVIRADGLEIYRIPERQKVAEFWTRNVDAPAEEETASARLWAEPNPVTVCSSTEAGITEIHWEAEGVSTIELRIDGADGVLFHRGGPTGSKRTGAWVRDQRVFLVDVSTKPGRQPPVPLAELQLQPTRDGCD